MCASRARADRNYYYHWWFCRKCSQRMWSFSFSLSTVHMQYTVHIYLLFSFSAMIWQFNLHNWMLNFVWLNIWFFAAFSNLFQIINLSIKKAKKKKKSNRITSIFRYIGLFETFFIFSLLLFFFVFKFPFRMEPINDFNFCAWCTAV